MYKKQFEKKQSFNKFKKELMRIHNYHDKYMQPDFKSTPGNIAPANSEADKKFGRTTYTTKSYHKPIKNTANRTKNGQNTSTTTTLPEISSGNGRPNSIKVAQKLTNIRKSFDDKDKKTHQQTKKDKEIMNTLISNYMASDPVPDYEPSIPNMKRSSKSINSRNKEINKNLAGTMTAENMQKPLNNHKVKALEEARNKTSHKKYPVSINKG